MKLLPLPLLLALLGWSAPAVAFAPRLEPGTYAGHWHGHSAEFTLTRGSSSAALVGRLVFTSGPFLGEPTQVEVSQHGDGTLRIVRQLALPGQTQVVRSNRPLFESTGGDGTVAVFEGPMTGHQAAGSGQLRLPTGLRLRLATRPRAPAVHGGTWHEVQALYYLDRRRGPVLEGTLVLLGGPFRGQATPLSVTLRTDGSLELVRDVGGGRVQRVLTARPRIALVGVQGLALFEGPLQGPGTVPGSTGQLSLPFTLAPGR